MISDHTHQSHCSPLLPPPMRVRQGVSPLAWGRGGSAGQDSASPGLSCGGCLEVKKTVAHLRGGREGGGKRLSVHVHVSTHILCRHRHAHTHTRMHTCTHAYGKIYTNAYAHQCLW